ncbi:MAG: hypothetical protein BroJett015_28330 [Chloroflexota bacterium]|nr:MAG: hypothetical protein BroJett015_28330 [Chloroflexota bacterium]
MRQRIHYAHIAGKARIGIEFVTPHEVPMVNARSVILADDEIVLQPASVLNTVPRLISAYTAKVRNVNIHIIFG